MLLYHPAFDFHHSLFRLLLIVDSLGGKSIEPEKLRILDFYFLFPREIVYVRLARLQVPIKQKFQTYPQYEAISSSAKVFYRLESIFDNSLKILVAAGLLRRDSVKSTVLIRRTEVKFPPRMAEALDKRKTESAEVLGFLVTHLFPFPLLGPDGLKDRTNLLPSKNDRR